MKRIFFVALSSLAVSASIASAEGVSEGYAPVTLYGGFSIDKNELVTEAVYPCNADLYTTMVDTSKQPLELIVVKTNDGVDCRMMPYRHELRIKLPKVFNKEKGTLKAITSFTLKNKISK
ncbi:hypothetical protein [Zooshikella harenae]|uniref:Uncharacterized protein n=1 Tax=Zooshikella harenae TaxID=2827238 RepID=A0ABS5ZBB6_9GAMM|nr:hypothetical protein [Zooshikella harenae]MBU2711351.1 hypothetical protein [Zooshikella harenae]